LFTAILEIQRKKYGELHENVGSALHNVGLVRLRLENYQEALDNFERAVRVRKGALGKDHPDVAVSQMKIGLCFLLMQQFDHALRTYLETLSIRKRALGALHPSLSKVYNNIACVHVEFNELKEARRAFEAALDIQRNALCHNPNSAPMMLSTSTTLCNLAYLYQYRDMPQKAALVLQEACEVSISLFALNRHIGGSNLK
jgi:tetratricopeptide (TPR) repeat protein